MRLGIHKNKSRERTAGKFRLIFIVVVLLIVVQGNELIKPVHSLLELVDLPRIFLGEAVQLRLAVPVVKLRIELRQDIRGGRVFDRSARNGGSSEKLERADGVVVGIEREVEFVGLEEVDENLALGL